MLIITGTGRCGTTPITLFCEKMGYKNPGGDNVKKRINGGCESNEIIKKIGDPLSIQFVKQNFQVVKTPQFMNSTTAVWDKWKDKNTKVLICFRDISETCLSFQKYKMLPSGKNGEEELSKIYETLSSRFKITTSELLRKTLPFRVIKFPNFLFHYPDVYKLLNDFAGFNFDYNQGFDVWKETMDTSRYSYGEFEEYNEKTVGILMKKITAHPRFPFQQQ